jgi:hypothetical protein
MLCLNCLIVIWNNTSIHIDAITHRSTALRSGDIQQHRRHCITAPLWKLLRTSCNTCGGRKSGNKSLFIFLRSQSDAFMLLMFSQLVERPDKFQREWYSHTLTLYSRYSFILFLSCIYFISDFLHWNNESISKVTGETVTSRIEA